MPTLHPDPHHPASSSGDQRLHDRIASLDRRLRAMETWFSSGSAQQIPVVATLAALPAGRKGRLVLLSSDNKVYIDNGSSWIVVGTQV